MNKNFYSKWISTFSCSDEIAACLILDVNPKKFLSNDINCDTKQKIETLATNFKHRMNPQIELNIFFHVDMAIQNCILLPEQLVKEITIFYNNQLPSDRQKFTDNYPYIAKKNGTQ